MSESRSAKRHRWRLPCEITCEGRRQRSFVLDLSETGLFVQTTARLRPGAEVEVRITIEATPKPIVLLAQVARSKQVPAQLASVARGGIGLQLHRAPQEYLDALAALQDGARLRALGDIKPATPSVMPARSFERRFRVRMKQSAGPRSRTLEIRADTREQAGELALRDAGAGWELVTAELLAS